MLCDFKQVINFNFFFNLLTKHPILLIKIFMGRFKNKSSGQLNMWDLCNHCEIGIIQKMSMIQIKEKDHWKIINMYCFYLSEIQITQIALVQNVDLPTHTLYLFFFLSFQLATKMSIAFKFDTTLDTTQGPSTRSLAIITRLTHITPSTKGGSCVRVPTGRANL